MRPIDYAKKSVNTMMNKYKAEELPPKGRFHYHQGVFLSGVYQTSLLSEGDDREEFFGYIKDWVDSVMDEQGRLYNCDEGQLDDIQPGILLFPLYEKTGDEKYKKVLDKLAELLMNFPKIPEGGYFHKKQHPNQMWLDGLYMAGPISAEYARRFDRPELMQTAYEQVVLMRKKTRDEKTGLWYHAYDDSRAEAWADKETGLSSEFWGRSMGWVPVAILDELDFIDENDERYKVLADIAKDFIEALCRFQHESGMWYQVVNKAEEEHNWPEVSCSCLYIAAICKAVRKGILSEDYLKIAKKGYEAVIKSLGWEGDNLLVQGVCVGTGVGDYPFYCARPTSTNDLHGVGAFLLMCAQVERVFDRM